MALGVKTAVEDGAAQLCVDPPPEVLLPEGWLSERS